MNSAGRNRDLAIEGKKAIHYDKFSRQYRQQDIKTYTDLVINHVGPGASILDIATGPGYFCIELARSGHYKITGVDISHDILDIAQNNAQEASVNVEFVHANASALQFPDESFDLVFCSWAMKNFKNPEKVLQELFRVLKTGGVALIVDINHDATALQWRQYALSRQIKGLTSFIMGIAFKIQRSCAYTSTQFNELLKSVPYRKCEIQKKGIELYVHLFK